MSTVQVNVENNVVSAQPVNYTIQVIEQGQPVIDIVDPRVEVITVGIPGVTGPKGDQGDTPAGYNELTASFNAFTSSYNTGSFTGSFYGDGSRLTGIVSSKWTGSNPLTRQSDVQITGSFSVLGSITSSKDITINGITIGRGLGSISSNTVLGSASLGYFVAGANSNNTAIGAEAMALASTANYNVAVGSGAMYKLATGVQNAALGSYAMYINGSGSYNTAVGYSAMQIATGSYNTAIGNLALASNTGSYNTTLGYRTMTNAKSAQDNVAVGQQTLGTGININYNTALGSLALYNAGGSTFGTASYNVALGYEAARRTQASFLYSSSYGIFIGTDVRPLQDKSYNEIVIGYQAIGSGSNTVSIGNSSITVTQLQGSVRTNGGFTGSFLGTASYAAQSLTSSNALTASYAPMYLPTAGGVITGNLQIYGTASITYLNVTYESASIIYSTGSNQLGDSVDDTQTLYGNVVITTGSLSVTGSITGTVFTGSGAGLTNIPAASIVGLNLSQIATGSISASVSLGAIPFSVVSGSTTLLESYIDAGAGIPGTGIKLRRVSDGSAGTIYYNAQYNFPDNGGNMLFGASTSGFSHGSGLINVRTSAPQITLMSNSNGGKGFYITVPTATNTFELWAHDNYNQSNRRKLIDISNTSDISFYPSGSATPAIFVSSSGNVGIGTNTPSFRFDVNGNARVQNTAYVNGISKDSTGVTTFVIEGYLLSTYTEIRGALGGSSANLRLYGVNATGNGSVTALSTSALVIGNSYLASSGYRLEVNGTSATSGSLLISGSNTQPAILGNNLTSVNITPTIAYTTGSQTQTALKVLATFSGSSAFSSSQTNVIADFGATSVGSQLIVTDVTSGSIYMVNDVSGIPIIEANSNWDVFMYDYPYTVFKKTGSAVEIGVTGQPSSSVTLKSDLIINEGLGFINRTLQVSGSTTGSVTSSLYNITFTNTSASVYMSAVVTGYDTGSRETITGDIKATIKYANATASVVGYNQTFFNADNSVVAFDIIAGGTSGSLVAYGTGSRYYQWGATVVTQVI